MTHGRGNPYACRIKSQTNEDKTNERQIIQMLPQHKVCMSGGLHERTLLCPAFGVHYSLHSGHSDAAKLFEPCFVSNNVAF